jgi:hypothetical protein
MIHIDPLKDDYDHFLEKNFLHLFEGCGCGTYFSPYSNNLTIDGYKNGCKYKIEYNPLNEMFIISPTLFDWYTEIRSSNKKQAETFINDTTKKHYEFFLSMKYF